jgi:hypothetical protein
MFCNVVATDAVLFIGLFLWFGVNFAMVWQGTKG